MGFTSQLFEQWQTLKESPMEKKITYPFRALRQQRIKERVFDLYKGCFAENAETLAKLLKIRYQVCALSGVKSPLNTSLMMNSKYTDLFSNYKEYQAYIQSQLQQFQVAKQNQFEGICKQLDLDRSSYQQVYLKIKENQAQIREKLQFSWLKAIQFANDVPQSILQLQIDERVNTLEIKEQYFQLFSENPERSYILSIQNSKKDQELRILILDTRTLVTQFGEEERNTLVKTQFLQGQNREQSPQEDQEKNTKKQLPHMYLRMNLKSEKDELTLDQVRMLFHKTGHALHSVLSQHDFQLPGNNYKIDYAQICSTLIENLLFYLEQLENLLRIAGNKQKEGVHSIKQIKEKIQKLRSELIHQRNFNQIVQLFYSKLDIALHSEFKNIDEIDSDKILEMSQTIYSDISGQADSDNHFICSFHHQVEYTTMTTLSVKSYMKKLFSSWKEMSQNQFIKCFSKAGINGYRHQSQKPKVIGNSSLINIIMKNNILLSSFVLIKTNNDLMFLKIHNNSIKQCVVFQYHRIFQDFQIFQIIMEKSTNLTPLTYIKTEVRNVCIIGEGFSGKTTIFQNIISNFSDRSNQVASYEGLEPVKRNVLQEQEDIRGLSLVSSFNKVEFLPSPIISDSCFSINLVDTPGIYGNHGELDSVLNICDGSIIVVNCMEGLGIQAQRILKTCFLLRVRAILFINQLDRLILQLQLTGLEINNILEQIIKDVNQYVSAFSYIQSSEQDKQEESKEQNVENYFNPVQGNVMFGSSLHGWAFTIDEFANIYQEKFCVEKEKMKIKLWGDNYFEVKEQKWKVIEKKNDLTNQIQNGFTVFILEPIVQLITLSIKDAPIDVILKALKIKFNDAENQMVGKAKMQMVMQTWLDISKSVLESCVLQLPSPNDSNRYQIPMIYQGNLKDDVAKFMVHNDAQGPLMMEISKIVNNHETREKYAFGRIYSGSLHLNKKISVQATQRREGAKKEDYFQTQIIQISVLKDHKWKNIESAEAGDIVGIILGLDSFGNHATITECDAKTGVFCSKIYPQNDTSQQTYIKPKDAQKLPQLLDAIQHIEYVSSLVVSGIQENTGNIFIKGENQVMNDVFIKDLKQSIDFEIEVSNSLHGYRETVIAKSFQEGMTASSSQGNKQTNFNQCKNVLYTNPFSPKILWCNVAN